MFPDLLSIAFPYCLHREGGGWVILNREYKPIGFCTSDFVDYSTLPIVHRVQGLTLSVRSRLDCLGRAQRDWIYLYNDGCNPRNGSANMRAYLRRFILLAKLSLASITSVL